jgi:plastocyanin
VFGGVSILLGALAILLTLLYWGREALAEYDHMAGAHPQLPAVVHPGPPPGTHIPGPSFRPILASLAVAILFAGLVFGGWILGIGVVVTILTLLGWLSDARKEYVHVVEADRIGHIVNEPAPAWPKGMLTLITVLVVASVALNLGWFPPRSASGADDGGSPAPSAAPSGGAGEITLIAKNVKFDKSSITVPADTPFKITLDNQDAGTPHDVDILDASGTKVVDNKEFNGPEARDYPINPLPAGAYTFVCSIHPTMTGTLTVQ